MASAHLPGVHPVVICPVPPTCSLASRPWQVGRAADRDTADDPGWPGNLTADKRPRRHHVSHRPPRRSLPCGSRRGCHPPASCCAGCSAPGTIWRWSPPPNCARCWRRRRRRWWPFTALVRSKGHRPALMLQHCSPAREGGAKRSREIRSIQSEVEIIIEGVFNAQCANQTTIL